MTDTSALLKQAQQAANNAFAPYSHFQVGAALLCGSGSVYLGCNVENASYPATLCAERAAFAAAVTAGERSFRAIAIMGGEEGDCTALCPPCGICRQVMREFCGEDFLIILGDKTGHKQQYSLGELLPHAFSL